MFQHNLKRTLHSRALSQIAVVKGLKFLVLNPLKSDLSADIWFWKIVSWGEANVEMWEQFFTERMLSNCNKNVIRCWTSLSSIDASYFSGYDWNMAVQVSFCTVSFH
jgi:hypothetical protein